MKMWLGNRCLMSVRLCIDFFIHCTPPVCLELSDQVTGQRLICSPPWPIKDGGCNDVSGFVQCMLLLGLFEEMSGEGIGAENQAWRAVAIPGTDKILAPSAAAPAEWAGDRSNGLLGVEYGFGHTGELSSPAQAPRVGDRAGQAICGLGGEAQDAGLGAVPAHDRAITQEKNPVVHRFKEQLSNGCSLSQPGPLGAKHAM